MLINKFTNYTKKYLLKFDIKTFASQFSRMQMKHKIIAKEEARQKQLEEEENKKKNISSSTRSKDSEHYIYPSPFEALKDIKEDYNIKDSEQVHFLITLNVDPKKGDHNIRGIFKMPGGSNKIPKLAVFTSPQFQDKAKQAGADILGNEDTVKDILDGKIDFEKCICTTEMLPLLKNVGRILGPKDLMPSTKLGTATNPDNLVAMIENIKAGSEEFKVDANGEINVVLGKKNFAVENLYKNLDSFMHVVGEKKPESIKGRYFLYANFLIQKKAFKIEMKSLDPKLNSYFMKKLNLV
jgi:large subunit ribosomal protein L1